MKTITQNEHVNDMLRTWAKLFKVSLYVVFPLGVVFFIFVLIMTLRSWSQAGLI